MKTKKQQIKELREEIEILRLEMRMKDEMHERDLHEIQVWLRSQGVWIEIGKPVRRA